MHINKAVITAAGRDQRALPLQMLIDRDGREKSVLAILVEEVLHAGVEDIAVIVPPDAESRYAQVVDTHRARIHFLPQNEPRGYGHAVFCAREFVAGEPFLHLVGDHLYVSAGEAGCARQLVELAALEACSVSAVQATRETLLPYYGVVGGRRLPGRKDLYQVEAVVEKPTPTEAEARLIVPGLRAGHYICFFGMHVLTPLVMDILAEQLATRTVSVTLSDALAVLATREKYLALEQRASRYDVGVKYGLLMAQIALALSGDDRSEVLTRMLELLAQRELMAVTE